MLSIIAKSITRKRQQHCRITHVTGPSRDANRICPHPSWAVELYVASSYSTRIFYRGVSGFATDCPCYVWCRRLTTCLLYLCSLFGNFLWPADSYSIHGWLGGKHAQLVARNLIYQVREASKVSLKNWGTHWSGGNYWDYYSGTVLSLSTQVCLIWKSGVCRRHLPTYEWVPSPIGMRPIPSMTFTCDSINFLL